MLRCSYATVTCLELKRALRVSGLGQIVDAVSIRERPAEVEDRAVPGRWEGDLLSGANNTHIATLVERHTRFAMLLKVPSEDTATVVAALGKHVRKLPQEPRRSLTWDRGKEMADHNDARRLRGGWRDCILGSVQAWLRGHLFQNALARLTAPGAARIG